LYDLTADPLETNNVFVDRRRHDVAGRMAGLLRRFQVELERDRERRAGR